MGELAGALEAVGSAIGSTASASIAEGAAATGESMASGAVNSGKIGSAVRGVIENGKSHAVDGLIRSSGLSPLTGGLSDFALDVKNAANTIDKWTGDAADGAVEAGKWTGENLVEGIKGNIIARDAAGDVEWGKTLTRAAAGVLTAKAKARLGSKAELAKTFYDQLSN